MIKRIFSIILLLVIGIPIVTLATINSHNVAVKTVSFSVWPWGEVSNSFPLSLVIFAAAFAGILLGGIIMWWSQRKWRRAASTRGHEAREWRREAERMSKQAITQG